MSTPFDYTAHARVLATAPGNNRYECKYCLLQSHGSAKRVIAHLACAPNHGVALCDAEAEPPAVYRAACEELAKRERTSAAAKRMRQAAEAADEDARAAAAEEVSQQVSRAAPGARSGPGPSSPNAVCV